MRQPQRGIHRLGVWLTVTLLLLPLTLSGHRHTAGQSSASDVCALCVVVHYSPATTTLPPPQLAPPMVAGAVTVVGLPPPLRLSQARPSGRAPPRFLALHAV